MARTRDRTVAAAMAVATWLVVTASAVAADRDVDIVDFAYDPTPVRIKVGDAVTWTNHDQAPHDANGKGWTTGTLTDGQSARVTFEGAGTYRYVCTFHPSMEGRVIVESRSGGGGGGTPAATTPPTDTLPAADVSSQTPPEPPFGAVAVLGAAGLGTLLAMRRPRASARTR